MSEIDRQHILMVRVSRFVVQGVVAFIMLRYTDTSTLVVRATFNLHPLYIRTFTSTEHVLIGPLTSKRAIGSNFGSECILSGTCNLVIRCWEPERDRCSYILEPCHWFSGTRTRPKVPLALFGMRILVPCDTCDASIGR